MKSSLKQVSRITFRIGSVLNSTFIFWKQVSTLHMSRSGGAGSSARRTTRACNDKVSRATRLCVRGSVLTLRTLVLTCLYMTGRPKRLNLCRATGLPPMRWLHPGTERPRERPLRIRVGLNVKWTGWSDRELTKLGPPSLPRGVCPVPVRGLKRSCSECELAKGLGLVASRLVHRALACLVVRFVGALVL